MKYLFIAAISSLICMFVSFSACSDNDFDKKRLEMVEKDIKGRGIKDKRVLDAMLKVQRHLFVPESHKEKAYNDHPIPIGEGQTISQPYIVALMTEAANLVGEEKVLEIGTGSGYQAAILGETISQPYIVALMTEAANLVGEEKVLEIGTGSGYQAAILGETAKEVYTIELNRVLYGQAKERLKTLGYKNIHVKHGDGYFGWDECAPFDVIMITAAADKIPPPLLSQLKEGGRIILPLGKKSFHQRLTVVTKRQGGNTIRELGGVIFVPMRGQVQQK